MTATGTVLSLHRWPVKSMGGEPVGALRVDGRGAAGDRTHALLDTHRGAPRVLTVRQVPRMLAWHATYDGADVAPDDPPLARLTAPDGTSYAWDDPALPAALADDLGRPVDLRRDLRGQQDLGETVLVTSQATLEAVTATMGRDMDLRRFRTNVHVAFDDGLEPYAEHGWEGRRMTIGEVELALLHPCVRCVIPTRDPDTGEKHAELLRWLTREQGGLFGINARVTGAGTIRTGDPVALG